MEDPVVTRVAFDGPVPPGRSFVDRVALALGIRLCGPRSGVRAAGLNP